MKIEGKVRWTVSGRFAIESDLLTVAKAFAVEDSKKPKSLTLVLELDQPYTIGGVPLKLRVKSKVREDGVTAA